MKIVIGLEKPGAGSVTIHGQEITRLAIDQLNEIRKKMGFVFQQAALYDSLTVEENVAFPLLHNTNMAESERRDRVHQLLQSVNMENDLQKLPSDISGGMRSAWAWRALWLSIRTSCCSMSRRPGLTPSPQRKSTV